MEKERGGGGGRVDEFSMVLGWLRWGRGGGLFVIDDARGGKDGIERGGFLSIGVAGRRGDFVWSEVSRPISSGRFLNWVHAAGFT